MNHYDGPNIAMTYSALATLSTLGALFRMRIDCQGILDGIAQLQRPNGRWGQGQSLFLAPHSCVDSCTACTGAGTSSATGQPGMALPNCSASLASGEKEHADLVGASLRRAFATSSFRPQLHEGSSSFFRARIVCGCVARAALQARYKGGRTTCASSTAQVGLMHRASQI